MAQTGAHDVQIAMDWILSHEEELVVEPVPQTSDSNISESPEKEVDANELKPKEKTPEPEVARSLKCDVCGKLFSNQTDVEVHASKTGMLIFPCVFNNHSNCYIYCHLLRCSIPFVLKAFILCNCARFWYHSSQRMSFRLL